MDKYSNIASPKFMKVNILTYALFTLSFFYVNQF
jgi:hypothetical protein